MCHMHITTSIILKRFFLFLMVMLIASNISYANDMRFPDQNGWMGTTWKDDIGILLSKFKAFRSPNNNELNEFSLIFSKNITMSNKYIIDNLCIDGHKFKVYIAANNNKFNYLCFKYAGLDMESIHQKILDNLTLLFNEPINFYERAAKCSDGNNFDRIISVEWRFDELLISFFYYPCSTVELPPMMRYFSPFILVLFEYNK